ncbi:AIPR family protein [Amycolatopsis sp. NBC_00348]|uniref:AIPR family protein n=1 Tax=Amycolatopsis sp. NBC_00348 TaxID=2975956 RepID=UPI002E26C21A
MDVVISGLTREFQKTHDLTALPESEAFEAFAAYCVLSSFYENEFAPDSFRTGGGNDLGIDAFAVLVDGDLLHDADDVVRVMDNRIRPAVDIVFIQAKTSSRFDSRVISDLADNLLHLIRPQDLPYPASDDVQNIRRCLHEAVYANIGKLAGRLPRLHVFYVSTGSEVAAMITEKATSAQQKLIATGMFDEVSFECRTQHHLRTLYRRATSSVTVTFPMPRRVVVPSTSAVEQAVTGLITAPELVDLVLTDDAGRLRRTLFHENFRDFQGYNEVNSKIRDTLCDPAERGLFSLYNLGITIVTRGLHPIGDNVVLTDFQIVNGCQTCHVLFDQRQELTDAVHVKLLVVHTQDEDVISGIAAATNRQTVISEEDLSVRDDFHRLLEEYFEHSRDKQRRLYYERRSKQYSERKDVEKVRVIGRPQLTRAYLAMFLDEPAGVGHFKSLLQERGRELFRPGQQPVYYYLAAATLYRVEWLLRNKRIDKKYAPARYHLLSAVRLQSLGDGAVDHSPRTAEKKCAQLLHDIWDPNASERLFTRFLRPLQRAMDAEPPSVPVGEMVRTQRFADRFHQELLQD